MKAKIDPDECLMNRHLDCVRKDEAHHREQCMVRTVGGREQIAYGHCLHRHTTPVEAGGEVVAHVCLHCDTQLPA